VVSRRARAINVAVAGTCIVLGASWAAMGLAKLLMPGASSPGSWSAQFPPLVVVSAASAEVLVGAVLLAGNARLGGAAGTLLLLLFSGALLLWPPGPGQTCGCSGGLPVPGVIEAMDPLLRNALASSLHLLLLAMCWPVASRLAVTTAPQGDAGT
jgi:uncharacterized membrane protein YphA (DoxX/SURF4 family)